MAKTFYTQDEACKKLDITPNELKEAVRNGELREFRDGGKVTYKVEQVDKLAAQSQEPEVDLAGSVGDLDMLSTSELTLEDSSSDTDGAFDLSLDAGDSGEADISLDESAQEAQSSGSFGAEELMLEPMSQDDSGIKLGTGTDIDAISLDDTNEQDSQEDEKEGTVVTSIGVSVFDDDEVEQEADPLAQTVVSDSDGALGIDGVGSGSGLLDLTRESDDTSLGAQLLEEIYPGDENSADSDEGTRAGVEEVTAEAADDSSGLTPTEASQATPRATSVVTRTHVEFAPDPITTGLTGMLFVAVLIMCVGGLAVAAASQEVWPAILDKLNSQPLLLGGGSLAAAAIAMGVGFVLGKKR